MSGRDKNHLENTLTSRQAGIVEHATTAHSFKHEITAWLQVRSAESFDILGPNLSENLQRLLHAANLLRPPAIKRINGWIKRGDKHE